jgi:aspartate racemase
MRVIGLLGGMSWESSAEYYRLANELVRERLGGTHSARCLLASVDFAEIEAMQQRGDWAQAARELASVARGLEAGGADLLVLCTNTMHKVADEVAAAVSIPLLHLGDVTARAVRRTGISTVGLLGTAYTMEQAFYRERLESHGLAVLVPQPADRAAVHRVIYDELCVGVISAPSRQTYREVISRLVAAGAQGIVLGCTEIELLISPSDSLPCRSFPRPICTSRPPSMRRFPAETAQPLSRSRPEDEFASRMPVAVVVTFEQGEAVRLELRLVVRQRREGVVELRLGQIVGHGDVGVVREVQFADDRSGAHLLLKTRTPLGACDHRHENHRRHRPERIGAEQANPKRFVSCCDPREMVDELGEHVAFDGGRRQQGDVRWDLLRRGVAQPRPPGRELAAVGLGQADRDADRPTGRRWAPRPGAAHASGPGTAKPTRS